MYQIGDFIRIISDNENYEDYYNMDLMVVEIATSTDEHPGYDNTMEGMQLLTLKTIEEESVPFCLYEY